MNIRSVALVALALVGVANLGAQSPDTAKKKPVSQPRIKISKEAEQPKIAHIDTVTVYKTDTLRLADGVIRMKTDTVVRYDTVWVHKSFPWKRVLAGGAVVGGLIVACIEYCSGEDVTQTTTVNGQTITKHSGIRIPVSKILWAVVRRQ